MPRARKEFVGIGEVRWHRSFLLTEEKVMVHVDELLEDFIWEMKQNHRDVKTARKVLDAVLNDRAALDLWVSRYPYGVNIEKMSRQRTTSELRNFLSTKPEEIPYKLYWKVLVNPTNILRLDFLTNRRELGERVLLTPAQARDQLKTLCAYSANMEAWLQDFPFGTPIQDLPPQIWTPRLLEIAQGDPADESLDADIVSLLLNPTNLMSFSMIVNRDFVPLPVHDKWTS